MLEMFDKLQKTLHYLNDKHVLNLISPLFLRERDLFKIILQNVSLKSGPRRFSEKKI